MSIILDKAESNFEAGKLLISEEKHASSIHCFYYSCLQKLIYISSKELNISIEEVTFFGKQDKQGSHQHVIKTVYGSILRKQRALRNLELARNFNDKMNEMRITRVNSDYKEIEIDKHISAKVKSYTLQVREILKLTHNV